MLLYPVRGKKKEKIKKIWLGVSTPNLQLPNKTQITAVIWEKVILMAIYFSVIWSNRDNEVISKVLDYQPGEQSPKK